MDAALCALNRFGLGARPGERAKIGDPRAWLRAQLEGGAPSLTAPESASPESIGNTLRAFRMAAQGDRDARRDARRQLIDIALAESRTALAARAASDRPYVERLVAFWSNHLCISAAAKVVVAPLAGSYEREAIRPHVLGKFEDLVLASARHPAMLLYLDNAQSVGPNSRGAQRTQRGAKRGLNENYARELLELHTLGVNGGYTQTDVQELAKILTGWTVSGVREPRRNAQSDSKTVSFAYQDALHEPGSATVLGKRYSGDGIEQGERAIRDLCRHRSTATFVATKLVTHFVADEPPPRAVNRIATIFHDTNGDLRAVSRALVDIPEAWSGETRKFRTPQEWLVAVLRAFNASEVNERTIGALKQLRHPLWSPQAPKGFGDSLQDWADPDSLMNRAEVARTIGRRLGAANPDPRALLDVVDIAASDRLRDLVADNSIPAGDRVALAIAGPAFQWR
jgi:uncharacterized protein (DUF1800 family)